MNGDRLADAIISLHWTRWETELRCRAYDTAAYWATLYLKGIVSFERAQQVWQQVDERLKSGVLR